MSKLLVLTNLPDRAAAERLADMLIEKQFAACVNILAPCRSVYRWKEAVQHDEEHPMLIKTTAERSEEHTSELQSPCNLVCRLLLEKKKKKTHDTKVDLTLHLS